MTSDLIEHIKIVQNLCLYYISQFNQVLIKYLKSMNRKHSIKEYLEIINILKEINPKIEFASDFIIAYPGENDDDFDKTCKLMETVKFINSYSFIYSPRPGTPASEMEKVDEKLAKERLTIFQNIAEKIKLNYKKKLLNKVVKVLFENKMSKEKNKYFGRDEYQNPVIVYSKKNINWSRKKSSY